jgi:hypothetical protein
MADFIAAARTGPAKPGDPLRSAVQGVGIFAGIALISAMALQLVGFTNPNTPQIWISLILLSMVGWHARTALRLLQTRVVCLEEELAALRAEVESTRRVAGKDSLAEPTQS